MVFLLAFSVGIFSVAGWPELPIQEHYLGAVALFSALIVYPLWVCRSHYLAKWGKLFVCILWGSCWGLVCAHKTLALQLPEDLGRQDFLVTGSIVGLVETSVRHSRFRFDVDSATSLSEPGRLVNLKLLQLGWYSSQHQRAALKPGQHWQFVVRLKAPRGLLNSGTFDYQRWLIQQGVSATGYLRPSNQNKLVATAGHSHWCRARDAISLWRHRIASAINGAPLSDRGKAIIAALTIGDKSGIAGSWDRLVRLGIVHLMIVSGLHIGLVAGLGFFLGSGFTRVLVLVAGRSGSPSGLHHVARWLPPIIGLVAAALYSLLAGFSLPTQRALIAVLVVMIAKLSFRRVRPFACVVWAILLIAVTQPLAVLSSGFWLSFVAVVVLIGWFYPWQSSRRLIIPLQAAGAQLTLTAGLVVPSVLLVGQASWLAPMVNLVAVPWVSLITVPLSLLGSLVLFILPQLAKWLWILADYSISGLWFVLDLIPTTAGLISSPAPLSPALAVAGLIAAVGWLLPRGIGGKLLCSLPLMTYLVAPVVTNSLRVTLLDVGQGLSAVVEAHDRVLVYDAGPAYGDKFNAGAGIIVPYLRSRGRSRINRLIISHEDGDHAGGLQGLLGSMPVSRLMVGPGLADYVGNPDSANYLEMDRKVCAAGQAWSWSSKAGGTVYFKILAPASAPGLSGNSSSNNSGNNSSCVLQIRWQNLVILLPGDIEQEAERELLAAGALPKVSLLVAPHHGSKTSSIVAFVAQVEPADVVFSTGYKHQFGHPHADVVSRYRAVGSRLWNTAEQGGLSFIWTGSGTFLAKANGSSKAQLKVESARQDGRQYWWRSTSVYQGGIMVESALIGGH
jgi:competence protein ComEC|tara:strand:+ start:2298 stop:4826 length:2529 start_codon:yes stop_codon:yes gene_type:complete